MTKCNYFWSNELVKLIRHNITAQWEIMKYKHSRLRKDSFHHWIHDCRWAQLYSDWAEKRVYRGEIIFRHIYVCDEWGGAESRGNGARPVEWMIMNDTCATHRSRVPRRSFGRNKRRSDDIGRRERTRPGFYFMFCVRQSSARGCRFSVMFGYFVIKMFKCSPVPASFFPYIRTALHWCRNPGRGSRHAAMQPAQPTPLAELVKSLAGLHQAQHQALLDMKLEQEDRFRLLVQAQDEDRRAIRSLLGREEFPVAAPSIAHVPLMRMGPHDDPEAFVDLFEKTAQACGWARTQWPVRLIPLLTGEAQVAAQQLPVANLLAYEDLKRAILQRVGRNPEQHRQRFRSVELGDSGRPFVMAQQLRDACRKWLMAESRDVEGVIDLVVLEQFIVRLPRRTAEWVQCHRPTSLTQAIQLAEDHMVACPGVGEPRFNSSLSPSLSPPSLPSLSRPVPAPRSRVQAAPRAPPRSGNGQGDRWPRRGGGAEPTSAPPSSLRQSLAYPSAAGAAVRPGPACWRCGDPGHFQDHCPMMEVGLLVRVPDSPTAAPDQAGQYQIPVSIKGGTYQALVDSGCNQTSIHQSLMQQRALDISRKVKVRCVHGDVADYPLVAVSIKFRGKTHRMEVAVNSHLKHPLILGTDWPAFTQLLGIVCADVSWQTGRGQGEAAAQAGEALVGPAPPASEGTRASEGVKPPELDDFPLEQSRDEALKNAFDRVRSVDGQLLQPNVPLSFPYFALIKERLYRVTQDAQSKEVTTQLLVPRSRREMIFQAAHCTPMAGHLGEAKTRERIMAWFFWPGIHENVRRWCAACRECQLVNPPATAKAPLRPLPLMEVPFERIGMDLIGPLERSARGHRFALVLVDYATRYPEAVPLRSISAKSVAEALFRLISRVGIPKEILTDQGTAFMSRTIKELYELLGIKSVRTSVYHPQTDGLVERFNRTLKTMVRKSQKLG